MINNEIVTLNNAEVKLKKANQHTPSKIQADTLFTFTPQYEFLLKYIKDKMISPRYCVEDIKYLNIPKFKKIAFPMKCFCDINLHRLDIHLEWYGYYGIAFSKEWGMKKGIQPVQYINPYSELRKDFSRVFKSSLKAPHANNDSLQNQLQSYILHELMYYKPYEGMMKNRNTGRIIRKCFTDECEWRYIPDVTKAGFQPFFYDQTIVNAGVLDEISNAMSGLNEISLSFEYSDIKYIIVKYKSDLYKLVDELSKLEISDNEKNELISKIIIWELSGSDF